MRILVDYRPALRERTGVGEYIRQLVRAYVAGHPGDLTVFTSSWKDRPRPGIAAELGVSVVDRRLPHLQLTCPLFTFYFLLFNIHLSDDIY